MDINYVIIIIALITCIVSIFLLFRVSKQFIEHENNNEKSKEYRLIMNYVQKIDKNTKELMDNMTKSNDNKKLIFEKKPHYSNEIEKLESLGFSKEEIAKKTNKSIREVDLILKLKKG
ncbi:hypothetical protein [Tepidibacter aestuarii]|uniref:hypothetical protein n=1 Tax=Tepidibacter aestuarii TaxID=2925782 RepID=UPI0020C06352|nr:hypothetical protein [Tepidibacter aestuarii]CAH2213995.1 Ribonuclease Y [Tepidibacter aestuarii]